MPDITEELRAETGMLPFASSASLLERAAQEIEHLRAARSRPAAPKWNCPTSAQCDGCPECQPEIPPHIVDQIVALYEYDPIAPRLRELLSAPKRCGECGSELVESWCESRDCPAYNFPLASPPAGAPGAGTAPHEHRYTADGRCIMCGAAAPYRCTVHGFDYAESCCGEDFRQTHLGASRGAPETAPLTELVQEWHDDLRDILDDPSTLHPGLMAEGTRIAHGMMLGRIANAMRDALESLAARPTEAPGGEDT